MSDDYEIDNLECPDCGHQTHSRQCSEIMCEGGGIDESEEDYLLPGTNVVTCETCKGTGIERWCPNCGKDLTGHYFDDEEDFTVVQLLGEATTVGELKKLLEGYSDDVTFGFRNQPMQSLFEVRYPDATFVCFQ